MTGRFHLNYTSLVLTGPIPAEIFKISTGDLPDDLCTKLPQHQGLYLSRNELSGQLPQTLGLCEHTQWDRQFVVAAKGSIGSVYEGVLSDGSTFAIKVFNLEHQSGLKSFDVECEVMKNTRHRNLVKVINSCSNDDFKAQVLEYMPNGSLEKWLYSHNHCLDLAQRLNVMIDVAWALEYLHHDFTIPVVHCDLKPSNILLDEDMVAHVGDFGIAKLFRENEVSAQTKTLGTIGYMAPEYGSEGMISTMGDVYSYGIMEIFTRKCPTDDMFTEGRSLKNWIEALIITGAEMELVDTNLLQREDNDYYAKAECLLGHEAV